MALADDPQQQSRLVRVIVRNTLGFDRLADVDAAIREQVLFGGEKPLFPYMVAAAILNCKDIGPENVLFVEATNKAYIIDFEDADSGRRRTFNAWADVCKYSDKFHEMQEMAERNVPKPYVRTAIGNVLSAFRNWQCIPHAMKADVDYRLEFFERLFAEPTTSSITASGSTITGEMSTACRGQDEIVGAPKSKKAKCSH